MLHRIKLSSKRNLAIALAMLLVIAGGWAYAQHRSKINRPVIPSTNPIEGNTASGQSKSSSDTSSQQSSQAATTPTNSQTAGGPPPLDPSGDFVSNHHPGGSFSTAEASTCNTSPGAVCYIEFKKGSVTKKLTAETADGKGATIWYWDVKSAGLDAGSWTVSAVATLNGQTKTSEDAMALVIQ